MKLVVHIGAGKTGSSSIQATIATHEEALSERGVHYLGLALEHAVVGQRYPWQSIEGMLGLLGEEDAAIRAEEVRNLLRDELVALKDRGQHTAIWSNEAFFFQYHTVLPALLAVQEEGHDVHIVCYLRRHDDWARSAYAQWGIKDKTYEGPLKSFMEWQTSFQVAFFPYIEAWNARWGEAFDLRNFGQIKDVSHDFLTLIGQEDLPTVRMYDTPPSEVVAAWAVHNAQFDGKVSPAPFEIMADRSGLLQPDRNKRVALEDLFPTEDELRGIVEARRGEISEINAVLESKGQPPFDFSVKARASAQPSSWETTSALMKIVFTQNSRIDHLIHRLNHLEAVLARLDGALAERNKE